MSKNYKRKGKSTLECDTKEVRFVWAWRLGKSMEVRC